MSTTPRHTLIAGARITSLGTLVSRLLGMLRDVATAALFGLSQGGVMDAFVVAFRIPNTFRRLFGEGALSASYLPVLTAELELSLQRARSLASVVFVWLSLLLMVLLALLESACGLVWFFWGDVPGMGLLTGLTAVMLPYMLFICLAAQAAATLNAHGHFAAPALAPALLNTCWLVGVWIIAPCLTDDKQAQAYVVAGCVLVSGLLQWLLQLLVLPRFGYHFHYDWQTSRPAVARIAWAMLPMTLGLAVTQINTLLNSFIAWGLSAPAGGPDAFQLLGRHVAYPLSQGAAASIYYGERMYELPLALFGLAVATSIYPLLSRHAARGDHQAVARDLTFGLRLVLFLALPAAVGLMIISEPLARLLFQRGSFTADDTLRAARVISCYAAGVWAYCAIPVLVRGFYSLGDRGTPVRVGCLAVVVNLALNLLLIWPMAEAGLATATSTAAVVQAVLLATLFSSRKVPLGWAPLLRTAARSALATIAMALVALGLLGSLPAGSALIQQAIHTLLPAATGAGAYLAVYWLLGGEELALLWGRHRTAGPDAIQKDDP